RPDNLRGGVDALREQLHALGLEAAALVFAIAQFDAATEARARALWNAASLRRGYRSISAALMRSAAQLERQPLHAAMRESFVLGGGAIRQLAHDPLLPEPIVPAAERAALVETMRAYDRLGRACWRSFMKSHDAPYLQTPRTAVAAQWPTGTGAIA